MSDSFELDPERALWKPGRRAFFFGLGAALLAPMLPDIPGIGLVKDPLAPPSPFLKHGDWITIAGVYRPDHPKVLQSFVVWDIGPGPNNYTLRPNA